MPIIKRGKKWYIDYYNEANVRIRKAVSEDRSLAKEALANATLRVERIRAGLETTSYFEAPSDNEFKTKIVDYINTRYEHRTSETYIQRLSAFLNYLEKSNLKIDSLDQAKVEGYISFRLNLVSNRTINNDITMLKAIFYKALRLKLIASNPFAGIKSLPVQKKKPFFYTKDQVRSIFNFIPNRFLPYFTILLETGIRVGELTLLHWNDIDWNSRLLNITTRRSVSKNRERSIPLSDRTVAALQERQKLNENDTLVFSTKNGKPIPRNTLRNVLVRAKKSANIRPGNVHSFRHTFASWFVQAGESIYELRELLGHSSITMTEIYAHLVPKKEDSAKMNKIFDI